MIVLKKDSQNGYNNQTVNAVRKMLQNVFKVCISDVLHSLMNWKNELYFTIENAYKNASSKYTSIKEERKCDGADMTSILSTTF